MVVIGSVRFGLGYQAHTTCAHTHMPRRTRARTGAGAMCTYHWTVFPPSVSMCSASFHEHISFPYGALYHWRKMSTVRGLRLLQQPWSWTGCGTSRISQMCWDEAAREAWRARSKSIDATGWRMTARRLRLLRRPWSCTSSSSRMCWDEAAREATWAVVGAGAFAASSNAIFCECRSDQIRSV